MSAVRIHPELAPIGFLVGTWSGEGHGTYPTINDFDYREEIVLTHVGRPFLQYHQRTWHADTGEPLHTEMGYWRADGDRVEVMICQPTGIVEVQEGRVEGLAVKLKSTTVGLASTAKEVTTIERNLDVTGDELRYTLLMGAVGQPHQVHLAALLRRV